MTNWKSTPESDVFHLQDGEARPLLQDDDGNLYEPVTPGSKEDPFTFRPQSLPHILYGLNKVVNEIGAGNMVLALELARRCQRALRVRVEAERDMEEVELALTRS